MQTVDRVIKTVERVQQARITAITIDCEDGTELKIGAVDDPLNSVPVEHVQSLAVGDYLIVDSLGQRHIVGKLQHEASVAAAGTVTLS
ncbi:hypothetical protein KEF85_05925 [Methylomonas paludis]|uniref:Uncharacterized protein n=1 Tax=Methylomonas paludis TaxID=1173101 RepID=A0A975MQ86_9GAMM|nr:hypothetical protein [Methylomonas paludis]QWF71992.1 hypothetical protein KEF85_05925 [Methylomonas paludis]